MIERMFVNGLVTMLQLTVSFFGRMTLKIRQCVANQLHSNLALAADVKGKIMTMIVKGISFLGSVLNIIRLL